MSIFLFKFLKKKFKRLEKNIANHLQIMSDLAQKIDRVIRYLSGERARLLDELASAREQLAAALANDAAQAEAVADAEAEAAEARANADAAASRVAELQALADADHEEDTALEAVASSVEVPADFE